MGQIPIGGIQILDKNAREIQKAGLHVICGQQNVSATARDNTGQSTDNGHTRNSRLEIKNLDPVGNRTRAAGMEGRESTDLATTDLK